MNPLVLVSAIAGGLCWQAPDHERGPRFARCQARVGAASRRLYAAMTTGDRAAWEELVRVWVKKNGHLASHYLLKMLMEGKLPDGPMRNPGALHKLGPSAMGSDHRAGLPQLPLGGHRSAAAAGACLACDRRMPAEKLKTCSRCRVATYCSAACQKSHWKMHKRSCSKMRSAFTVEGVPKVW